jgi:hypothetical protein
MKGCEMKFIIQQDSFRIIYQGLEQLTEEAARLFRFLIYIQADELVRGSTIYRIER